MNTSLYDLTVASQLQVGGALAKVLDQAADHFPARGVDLEEIARGLSIGKRDFLGDMRIGA